MIRLVRTELARFWSRRLVLAVTLLAMAASVAGVAIGYVNASSEGPTAEQQQAETEQQQAQCIRQLSNDQFFLDSEIPAGATEEEIERLIRDEYCNFEAYIDDRRFPARLILADSFGLPDDTPWIVLRPDTSQVSEFRLGSETYRSADPGLTGVIPGVATFFLVVAVIIGGSFMGAEYKFGTVENLLLWEPRRLRVLAAKLAAGFLSAFALTVFLLSFLSALLFLLANLRGYTTGIDGRFWLDLASTVGRASVVAGLFFILAMSVSVVARNTTAGVGVVLGWFVISNILIEAFAKWLRPYEIFTNAAAFISEGNVGKYVRPPGSDFHEIVYSHDYLTAGGITAVWCLGFAAIAAWVFAARDVD